MYERKDKKDNLWLPALTRKNRFLKNRRISLKWFFAIIFMEIFGASLMGLALFATTEGRVQLSKLAHSDVKLIFTAKANVITNRLLPTMPLQRFGVKKIIDIGVSQNDFGDSVIKPQKFELLHLSLAEINASRFKYPVFDALKLFDNLGQNNQNGNIEQLYNAKVDSEIIFKQRDFDPNIVSFAKQKPISSDEAILNIRKNFNRFNNNITRISNLIFNYTKNNDTNNTISHAHHATPNNISYIPKSTSNNNLYNYTEDLLHFKSGKSIYETLKDAHYEDKFAKQAAKTLESIIDEPTLKEANAIRLGLESDENGYEIIVRASLYNKAKHLATIAMNDNDIYVKAKEPETTDIIQTALLGKLPEISNLNGRVITLYDSIYRAALNYNMPLNLIQKMLSIMARDIDLQSSTSNNDIIDIFFPSKDSKDIIYIKADINGKTHKYYRYKALNRHIDYFNSEGKSAKQFLLRKPVPNAHFSSPFGARRHPILGSVRMHTGVDWAAPLHSVIIAAGDGIITKIGPTPGYGNHTEIQHANGYMTSYSHQSGYAAGMRKGVHVHQGQVIGYIGSTGLSTGAHCHFEIVINGIKQNPMRVHLPQSRILTGQDLNLFEQKRNNIDTVLRSHGF